MRRTTALAQILGSGHGIDPFATTGRWPNRQHPRRDGEGHDGGDGGNTDQGDTSGGADNEGDGKPDADTGDDEKLGEGGKKALERERAARKELEKKLAERDKADEKARLAKLDEKQRAEAERDAAAKEAEKARAELAVERAARKHGITDDKHLAILAKVAPDDVDEVAKTLAASKGKDFGREVGGGRTDSFDPNKIAEHVGTRKSGITIY
ncbi:hypothetical protein ACRAJ3_11440 [Rhodococcus pyridinivorans]|uniref:hypothetical protein n=1 Tax=Rhodococcus pyridinivorans TaxID=103816 RepID=UPI003D7F8E74